MGRGFESLQAYHSFNKLDGGRKSTRAWYNFAHGHAEQRLSTQAQVQGLLGEAELSRCSAESVRIRQRPDRINKGVATENDHPVSSWIVHAG